MNADGFDGQRPARCKSITLHNIHYAFRPRPTEDERDDWHRLELSELIAELSNYLSALRWQLGERESLADPISTLVMKAYDAGRLNPLPIQPQPEAAP